MLFAKFATEICNNHVKNKYNMKKAINMKILLLFAVLAAFVAGCSHGRKNTAGKEKSQINVDDGKNGADSNSVGSGKVGYLTTAEFKKKVMDYDLHPREWVFEGDRPVIVDFYATWCRPCKMTAPIVEDLAKDYKGKIDFYKVDIDKEQELAAAFGIQSIPTFLFVPAKGNPTMQTGAMQKEDFEKIIKSILVQE